jgi:NAD(P)-dependent dehydrogenase (short-subunit alcohol dehydrogenase family)
MVAFADAGWSTVGLDVQTGGQTDGKLELVDVSSPEQVQLFFERLASSDDGLGALVNNAAVPLDKPLADVSDKEWDRVLGTNLRSVYLTCRHAHGLLSAANGAIVNVASVHAAATSINISAYAASKGGVLALTRALALEFAADGIRVNAVLPGAVDTTMFRQGLSREQLLGRDPADRLDELKQRTPLRRVGRPEEVAQAILFLADSQRSSFITGQALAVDGGALARLSTE